MELPSKKSRQSTGFRIADQFRGAHSRSCPGQPPRERNGKAYNQPFAELHPRQRAAACQVLGIAEEQAWELAMPRRIRSSDVSTVVVFQTSTWSRLTPEHQKLAVEQLDMTESFWNGKLALFHDDLWNIPEITLSPAEFTPVLATIQKMGQSHVLTKKDVAQFLWSLGKLLLPSQGVQIVTTLKASSSWESLLESAKDSTDQYNSKFHINLVVACFLTYPERFVDIPHNQLNMFWDDDCHGCVWGNAAGRNDTNSNAPKTYREALSELPLRRCVASILTGTLPVRVRTNRTAQLPILPKSVVKFILDDMLGTSGKATIDPFTVSWLYGYDTPLTVFF